MRLSSCVTTRLRSGRLLTQTFRMEDLQDDDIGDSFFT